MVVKASTRESWGGDTVQPLTLSTPVSRVPVLNVSPKARGWEHEQVSLVEFPGKTYNQVTPSLSLEP